MSDQGSSEFLLHVTGSPFSSTPGFDTDVSVFRHTSMIACSRVLYWDHAQGVVSTHGESAKRDGRSQGSFGTTHTKYFVLRRQQQFTQPASSAHRLRLHRSAVLATAVQ